MRPSYSAGRKLLVRVRSSRLSWLAAQLVRLGLRCIRLHRRLDVRYVRTRLTAAIRWTEFIIGYDQGVIANILVMEDFLHRWPITPWQKGVMSTHGSFPVPSFAEVVLAAALELGSLFGALIAGFLADRYSRRHSIFMACSAWPRIMACPF
jgi:MFS family permease